MCVCEGGGGWGVRPRPPRDALAARVGFLLTIRGEGGSIRHCEAAGRFKVSAVEPEWFHSVRRGVTRLS